MYQRRCADPVVADKRHGEHKAGRTWQGFSRQEHAGQQWHRGRHRCHERLLGEIADVWQPRSVVGIRAGVVVRLVGCLVVKDARCQADGGEKVEEGHSRAERKGAEPLPVPPRSRATGREESGTTRGCERTPRHQSLLLCVPIVRGPIVPWRLEGVQSAGCTERGQGAAWPPDVLWTPQTPPTLCFPQCARKPTVWDWQKSCDLNDWSLICRRHLLPLRGFV